MLAFCSSLTFELRTNEQFLLAVSLEIGMWQKQFHFNHYLYCCESTKKKSVKLLSIVVCLICYRYRISPTTMEFPISRVARRQRLELFFPLEKSTQKYLNLINHCVCYRCSRRILSPARVSERRKHLQCLTGNNIKFILRECCLWIMTLLR